MRWRRRGDRERKGASFVRSITQADIEHFKQTGQLPPIGSLPSDGSPLIHELSFKEKTD
jgi:hypothetical protein